MGSRIARTLAGGGLLIALGALAACGPRPVQPPPPPPPPPPVVYIPPRPLPPLGVAAGFAVPALDPGGVRLTVNAGISPAQTVWNLRSAYNVAALNCLKPEHTEILAGYKQFLAVQKGGLATANKTIDAEFKQRHGAAYIAPREAYMTRVYNFYAYPPTLGSFCDAALAVARESLAVRPAELDAFSVRALTAIDAVYENFFRAYEQYRADAAAWDARYAPTPAASPPVTATPSA